MYLIGGALAVAGAIYFVSRPAKAMGPMPAGPLRPPPLPPSSPPPSPGAVRIREFIDGMSDAEIVNLRNALPEHWWDYILSATMQTSDPMIAVAMNPAQIDYAAMDSQQREQLQADLLGAVGMLNALELKGILEDHGVIA